MMGTQTPWGWTQDATHIAPGVTFYETASHGGFHVTPDAMKAMPPALRALPVFCGEPGWYEEDCDAVIVVLAFPVHFDPRQVLNAIEQTAAGGSRNDTAIQAFLRSPDGILPCAIAARYQQEFGHLYQGFPGGTRGREWEVTAHRISDDARVYLRFPGVPIDLPRLFSIEEAIAAGGRVVS